MRDLNAAEVVELEGELQEWVRNRRLDGLDCIVILSGRGLDRLAYPADLSAEAPSILERAYLAAKKRNMREAN